jgi:Ser/Thr protein kinase RdoA (MazF antagonist)
MATEWIDGEGGTSVFDEVERAAAVGEALACLHQAPVGVGPLRARNDELRDLRIVGNGLANLLPKQAPRVMHLSRALADGLAVTRGPLVPTHGDFALRQVVFARDGVALTDLDAAAIAEPANDIGSFLADLDLHVVNGDLDVGRSGVIASRFLDGYRSVRALPAGTELYPAIHLLRVAPQPFRMRSREWCIRADALVDRAEAAIARRRRSRD